LATEDELYRLWQDPGEKQQRAAIERELFGAVLKQAANNSGPSPLAHRLFDGKQDNNSQLECIAHAGSGLDIRTWDKVIMRFVCIPHWK
jgi:hypothetical protein